MMIKFIRKVFFLRAGGKLKMEHLTQYYVNTTSLSNALLNVNTRNEFS